MVEFDHVDRTHTGLLPVVWDLDNEYLIYNIKTTKFYSV